MTPTLVEKFLVGGVAVFVAVGGVAVFVAVGGVAVFVAVGGVAVFVAVGGVAVFVAVGGVAVVGVMVAHTPTVVVPAFVVVHVPTDVVLLVPVAVGGVGTAFRFTVTLCKNGDACGDAADTAACQEKTVVMHIETIKAITAKIAVIRFLLFHIKYSFLEY